MGDIANQLRRRRLMTNRAGYIRFEDPEVERICVANFSSDGIGVTYDDAAAVTNAQFGGFAGNSAIVSFDEFKYFTSVTSIGWYKFDGCSNLQRISFPDSLNKCEGGAFRYCNSIIRLDLGRSYGVRNLSINSTIKELYADNIDQFLNFMLGNGHFQASSDVHLFFRGREVTSITIPNTITSIPSYAFSGYNSITSITIPQSVESLGDCAFSNSGITSINISSSVTSVGVRCFNGCRSLQTAVFNANISALPNGFFTGCTSLVSVILSDTITTFKDGQWDYFAGDVLLTEFTFPSNFVRNGGYRVFNGSGLTTISSWGKIEKIANMSFPRTLENIAPIPATLTEIDGSFSDVRISQYVFLSTTPPTAPSNSWFLYSNSLQKIYVPYSADDSIINAYKNDASWSRYAGRIFSLNPDGTVPTT